MAAPHEGRARRRNGAHPARASTCRAVFDAACEVYEAAGYRTQRTKEDGEVLRHGFFHGLGHGVGLEVHEGPYMGIVPGGELVAGDVVTSSPASTTPPSAASGSRTSCS